MTPPTDNSLPDLDTAWESHWGDTPPLGHLLRTAQPDRWVRFHSLPRSKRYAVTEEEYVTLLGRQHMLLADLGAPQDLVVITCEWSDDPSPRGREPDVEQVAPGDPWRTVLEDETEAPEFRTYTHLYMGTLTNLPTTLDPLLRKVADFETAGVILAPRGLGWLFHPYDGGVDVITATPAERDALSARHPDWLSRCPGGL
ncbi:hypothetical protein ACFXCZ_04050 [Streptomyces sp. NPDC059396]|uniref:DUF3885 domain-containing protein n=1 Tax=Streptomyces sp. NPDC059396 TaxID=3346819 RepID=UPI0036CC19EE